MTCNQRHEAPLWMNVRFQGCVVGVDFCGNNNKNTMTVTIFVRIQNVRIASAAMPQQSGVWLSSCPNIVKVAGGIFSLAFYGVGGWRPICQYDIAQTAPSKVLQQLSMLLNCFGPVV